MSANVGSVATLTGNPQNIIIGSVANIAYAKFFVRMLPVSLLGLLISFFCIYFFYKKDLNDKEIKAPYVRLRYNRALTYKTGLVSLIVIACFMIGFPMEFVAIGAGAFLLITRRIKPEKVYNLIDYRLLVLFIGLFILIKPVELSPASSKILKYMGDFST